MGGCASKNKIRDADGDEGPIGIHSFSMEVQLGKGGYGVVHACEKLTGPDKGTMYALKEMDKSQLRKEKQRIAEAMTERNILANVHHPYLCNLRYAFQDDEKLYLVLDIALGGDLRYQQRHNGPNIFPGSSLKVFPEDWVKYYTASMVLALGNLHQVGIIMRDMKEANILMEATGAVKLSDFGVSAFADKDGKCHKGSGTPGYMAPEIYQKNHEHSFDFDWFALGVTAFQLATASFPFPSEKIRKASVRENPGALETEGLEKKMQQIGASSYFVDFIIGMCAQYPENRLGGGRGPRGCAKLQTHRWFDTIDFALLEKGELPAPYMPDVSTANCAVDGNAIMDQFDVGQTKKKRAKDIFDESNEPDFAPFYFKFDENQKRTGTVVLGKKARMRSRRASSASFKVLRETVMKKGVEVREFKSETHLKSAVVDLDKPLLGKLSTKFEESDSA